MKAAGSFKILEPVYQTTLSYPGSDFGSHHRHDSLKSTRLIAEFKPCFMLMANLKIQVDCRIHG